MDFTTQLAALVSITFIAMMSPGPDMLLITRHSLSHPEYPSVAVSCAAGITAGIAFHVLLALSGVSVLLATNPSLAQIVTLAGACYLGYLGWQLLQEARKGQGAFVLKDSSTESGPPPLRKAFTQGMWCNLMNPKVTLFILALFTQVISVNASIPTRILLSALLLTEVFLVWSLFSVLIRRKAVLKAVQRHSRKTTAIAGALLLLFAALLATAS